MLDRLSLRALFFAALALPLAGCTNPLVDTLSVSPTAQTLAVGQTVQFTATGVVGHGTNHPPTTSDVTNQVTWSSSTPSVATVSTTGLATALAAGTTTITATINGFTGLLTTSAQLSVGGGSGLGGGTAPSGDVVSILVIPGTQTVSAPGGTATFIPIGTTAGGQTVNLTGLVTWASSSNQIGTVTSPGGFATGVSAGSTTITAGYTNPDQSIATGTASFQVLASASELVTALTIFPGGQSATSLGQQGQFTVLGTENGAQYDLTGQVVWTSSTPSVATVGTTGNGTPGLATAVAAGSTTIEATYTNKDGSQVIAQASYSVTAGASPEPLLSINIVPASITVSNMGMTGQYLAFGTFSTPPLVRDITDEVTWLSLLPEVASIGNSGTPGELAGLATAEGYTGFTPIYAEDTKTNPDGTLVLSNTQTFTCKDPNTNQCNPWVATPQFSTLTVYVKGENTSPTGEYVTAPSDTGTADLIHCGPDWTGAGGQVCTGTYETGSTVTLTENLPAGSTYFGGWSSGTAEALVCTIETGTTTANTCGFSDPANPPAGWYCNTVTTGSGATTLTTSSCYYPVVCKPALGYTNTNSPTCTLPLLGNATVGVIFY